MPVGARVVRGDQCGSSREKEVPPTSKQHETDPLVWHVVSKQAHDRDCRKQETPDDHHGTLANAGDQPAGE